MYDDDDPRPAGRSQPVLAAFFTSLITTGATFAGVTFADSRGHLDFPREQNRVSEVPSITGVTVEQARDLLRAKGLLLTLQAERADPATVSGARQGADFPLRGRAHERT